MNPRLATITLRPLTRACWRETLYLLVGLATGVVGFTFVVSAASTSLGLSILIVGLPTAVLVAHVDRWWCGLERSRATLVLNRPVVGPYAPPQGETWIPRMLSVLRDRQVWLDAVWMLISLPLGVTGFVVAVTGWSVALSLLTAPIYAWSIPDWVHRHVVLVSVLGPFVGVAAAILAAWLVRAAALGQASLAALLLGPSRAQALERRVQTLSEPGRVSRRP